MQLLLLRPVTHKAVPDPSTGRQGPKPGQAEKKPFQSMAVGFKMGTVSTWPHQEARTPLYSLHPKLLQYSQRDSQSLYVPPRNSEAQWLAEGLFCTWPPARGRTQALSGWRSRGRWENWPGSPGEALKNAASIRLLLLPGHILYLEP